MDCLLDGNNELEAQFDVNVDKELESKYFFNESNGILTIKIELTTIYEPRQNSQIDIGKQFTQY